VAIVAGIDEAGYGPLLGPLVVSCAAFRVAGALPGDPPDLWERIGPDAVSRTPPPCPRGKARAAAPDERLTICDSKKLYHGGKGLARMEESVLAVLALTGAPGLEGLAAEGATTLRGLHRATCEPQVSSEPHVSSDAPEGGVRDLDASLERYPWFAGKDVALPEAGYRSVLLKRAALLRAALGRAGVEALRLTPSAVHAEEFNGGVRRLGNKHNLEWGVVGGFLRALFETHGEEGVDLTCDRLGGRIAYGPPLARLFPEARVTAPLESPERSVYQVARGPRRMVVRFLVEGDDKSFPVALASCASKYVRELFMKLLNAWFQERLPGLKETAGYALDGRRFANEVEGELRRLEIAPALLLRSC